jgi:3-oxoacyl-[acyl-carrier protein] reductase
LIQCAAVTDTAECEEFADRGFESMKTLNGRVAVITGAAGGIGAALVQRFLVEGAIVLAVDISEERLEALRATFRDVPELITAASSVSDDGDCRRLAGFAKERLGHVDILINNAGYFPTCSFEDMTYSDWKTVIGINLDGVFLMTHAFLPLLKTKGWGRIINVGSSSVFRGVPMQTHYVAAKAGVVGFSRSLALALGKDGITVNVVAPGLTSTEAVVEEMGRAVIENRRLQRAIPREQRAEDLVGVVAFLASNDSDFITGQIINVDGGNNMH